MEPVTHVLTGACLARAGLNRKAAYTTLTMAVAAEFPDIDTVWGLRGPVAGFQHHRGITHTLLGIPFEALLIVAMVYGFHRWRLSGALRRRRTRPLTQAEPRWILLYGFTVLALLSHIALDFTNNYGVRPFFPFNPHWYAASIVFIFDPWLFGILLLALGLPWIFRMVSVEIGGKKEHFRGRGLARAALVLVLCYYGMRSVEHEQAERLAELQPLEQPGTGVAAPATGNDSAGGAQPAAPTPVYLQPQRVLANPDPLSMFRWYTVTDYGPVYQLGTADTEHHEFVPADYTQPKPDAADPAIAAAERSPLGRVYLDWSPMPFLTAMSPSEPEIGVKTYVTFRDPRFMGETPILHRRGSTPLTGTVALDAQNRVVHETMDGSSNQDSTR